MPIIKIGEDHMLGAYIMEKKFGSKYITKLVDKLLQANQEWRDKEELINSPDIRNYFKYCWEYGIKMAKEELEEKIDILRGVGKFYTTDHNLRYI